MKKYLITITFWFGLISIIGIASLSIKKFSFYGNPLIDRKLTYFNSQSNKYNTLLIGSSRVYRQLNPEILDSICGTSSYNLGAPASSMMENLYTLHRMDIEAIQTLILELQPIMPFNSVNENTYREIYIEDSYILPIHLSNYYEKKNFPSYVRSIKNYIKNIYSFYKWRTLKKSNPLPANNGFKPLNMKSDGLRNKEYRKDTLIISRRLKENTKMKINTYSTLEKEIIKLNNKLKSQNTQLIIYLPPIFKNTVNTSQIENAGIPIINMYDPKQYPEFYESKNIFDKGHLNLKGANILTEKFANQLLNILDNK